MEYLRIQRESLFVDDIVSVGESFEKKFYVGHISALNNIIFYYSQI